MVRYLIALTKKRKLVPRRGSGVFLRSQYLDALKVMLGMEKICDWRFSQTAHGKSRPYYNE